MRDFLGAKMFLHRHREVGAALDGGVIRDDHHFASGNAADAGNDTRAWPFPFVHVPSSQLSKFEKRGSGVQKTRHPIPCQQLAPRDVARPGSFGAPECGDTYAFAQLRGKTLVVREVATERFRGRIDLAFKFGHERSG